MVRRARRARPARILLGALVVALGLAGAHALETSWSRGVLLLALASFGASALIALGPPR